MPNIRHTMPKEPQSAKGRRPSLHEVLDYNERVKRMLSFCKPRSTTDGSRGRGIHRRKEEASLLFAAHALLQLSDVGTGKAYALPGFFFWRIHRSSERESDDPGHDRFDGRLDGRLGVPLAPLPKM